MTKVRNTITKEYLAGLNRDELMDLKMDLDEQLIVIKGKIEAAINSTQEPDKNWYVRIKTANRIKCQQIQLINSELQRRKAKEKLENVEKSRKGSLTFANAFWHVAKATLPAQTIEQLIRMANERIESLSAGVPNVFIGDETTHEQTENIDPYKCPDDYDFRED